MQDTDSPVTSENSQPKTSAFSRQLQLIRALPAPPAELLECLKISLGPKKHKYTLILDLDDTLVHTVPITSEGNSHEYRYSILIRPYARSLLERMSQLFEVVIFTAGCRTYASAVVEFLDPERQYVSHLITGESCVKTDHGLMIKDLRIFIDRNLNEMLIVDNNVISFAFNLENGIPVTSYMGEEEDEELMYLMDYLEGLARREDLLVANKERVGELLEL